MGEGRSFAPASAEAAWVEFGRLSIMRLAAEHRSARGDDVAPATADGSPVEQWHDARRRFGESLSGSGAFASLAANVGLSIDEAEALAIAATCELDGRWQRLLAYVQGDTTAARISLDTLNVVFGDEAPRALVLGPDGILRRSALVSLSSDGGPWSDQRLAVHPSVVWALIGDGGRDPDLPADCTTLVTESVEGEPLSTVTGSDRLRRQQVAATLTRGDRFVAASGVTGDSEWAALVREATITGAGVIVDVGEELDGVGRRWIERADHLPWAITSPTELAVPQLPRRRWVAVEVPPDEPTDEEWAEHLGETPRSHRLSLQQLDVVGRAFDAYGGDLDAAVRRLVSGRLERLARRVRPRRSWDELVLSAERRDLLESIVDRYRHAERVYGEWGFPATPSRGLVALFSGPSGTGKTMAAEIVAGELGLDLFKIDLSAVVSKYIGETEKNLEEVFEAASAGNLLLFFDEADSLFGKRSEVKDARDRYANIEVSYLLQRLEIYDGLVVMATNFERNIDEAFLRRIHTRIDFVLPEVQERRGIWDRNLPPGAPIADIDTQLLAERFELSGAAIRNAAVHAAFLAAAAGTPITMDVTVQGVARELRKMGRLLKASDFKL